MNYLDFRRLCFAWLNSDLKMNCGSMYELPIKYVKVNCADFDTMSYRYDICAIPLNRRPPKNFKGMVLRIESRKIAPGFAKLESCDALNRCSSSHCCYMMEDRYFRRPHSCGYYGTISASAKGENNLQAISRLGGNVKILATAPGYPNITPRDDVSAVYCPYWPLEAEEWRTRKRNHGWPDEKLITRTARGGCHFVSKLLSESSFDNYVWRFSFSKAELILIHSWTEVQKSVYHFIRVIIRTVKTFAKDKNKAFQTYFFKTLMLWACEERPRECWSERNIETCVLEILGRMVECLIDRHCPSYFIPACNIMSHLANIDLSQEIEILVYYIEKHATRIIFDNLCIHGFQDKKHLKNIFPENLKQHIFNDEIVFLPGWDFELMLFRAITEVNPLNAELNGRLGHYLSDCEWFLPEIKFLHTAIEASLRLMKIDSVSARRDSEHYATFLRSMNRFFYGISPRHGLHCNLSYLENINQSLLGEFRKQNEENRTEFQGQCQDLGERSVLNDDTLPYDYPILALCPKHREHTLLQNYVRPICSIFAAHNANFYFATLKLYQLTLEKCDEFFQIRDELINSHNSHIPMLISTTFSQIYDEHIRVILGFATLHKATTIQNSFNRLEACLNVCPIRFLEYLRIQCQRKLFTNSKTIAYSRPILDCPITPGLSHLHGNGPFSDMVLFAALYQSGANVQWSRNSKLKSYCTNE